MRVESLQKVDEMSERGYAVLQVRAITLGVMFGSLYNWSALPWVYHPLKAWLHGG